MKFDYEHYNEDKHMDNVTREQIVQLIEDLGNEVIFYTSMGRYEDAQAVKAEMDQLIEDLQN